MESVATFQLRRSVQFPKMQTNELRTYRKQIVYDRQEKTAYAESDHAKFLITQSKNENTGEHFLLEAPFLS